jgi:carbon storage regulator
MLVLSRQKDESIMIGDEVEITIVDVRGDKVRLGITAPKSIAVHRREIYDAIQKEKRNAAAGDSNAPAPADQAKEEGSPRLQRPAPDLHKMDQRDRKAKDESTSSRLPADDPGMD